MEALRTRKCGRTHTTCSINRHHRGAALVEYLPPLLFALMITIPAWAMYGDVVRQQLANAATKLAENYYHGWFWPVEEAAAAGSPGRPGSGAEGGPSTGEDGSAGGGTGGGLPGSGNPFSPAPGSDIGNPFAPDSGGAGGDAPLQCSTPTGGPQMSPVGNAATYTQIGNPIDLGTGNKLQTEHDYHSWRPAGLQFVRYYNSVLGAENTGLGYGWRHSYQRAIVLVDKSDIATVWHDDGSQYHFTRIDGQWQPPLGIVEQLASVIDDSGNRTGWTYTTANEQVEHYDTRGRLQRIDHPGGQSQQLIYNDEGRLSRIVDSRGEQLVLQWRGAHLQRVTTPAGDRLTYDYDERLNLATVVRRVDGLRGLFAGLRTPERRYHYDDSRHPHALTGLDDATGQRFATWAYDELGRAISSEHGDGAERISLDYRRPSDTHSRERVVAVTNALGHRAIYTLEPARAGRYRLKAIDGQPLLNCAAVAQRHHYDDRGFLVRRYNVDGVGSEYRRDSMGRIVEAHEGLRFDTRGQGRPATGATRIDYRWQGQTSQLLGITRHGWIAGQRGETKWQPVIRQDWQRDPRGRLVSEVVTDLNPATEVGVARTSRYRYIERDAASGERAAQILQTLEVTDPLGNVTAFHYDTDERLQTIVNALGQRTHFADFTRTGSPRHIELADGQQLRIRYDARGRPTQLERHPANSSTVADKGSLPVEISRIRYDAEGRPVIVERPDGSRDEYRYNAAGQLVERRNGWGEQIELTPNPLHGEWETAWRYDANGDPVLRQSRHFNALGQLAAISHDDEAETRYDYDASGNLIAQQDGHENPAHAELMRISTARYDTQLRLLEWIDAAGHATHYDYSAGGHLAAITDGNGNTTHYRRNGFGEIVRQQSPASGDEWRHYDGNGNLVAKGATAAASDADDSEPFDGIRFRYDALDRLVFVDYPDDSDDVTYTYDQSDSEHGNGIGRLTRIETARQRVDYRYDNYGRKIAERTRDIVSTDSLSTDAGLQQARDIEVGYRYLSGNRLEQIIHPDGSVVHYRYNNERIVSVDWREAGANSKHGIIEEVDYAPFGGPIAWTYGNDLRRTTELDLQGRVTHIALQEARKYSTINRDSGDLLWQQRYSYDLYQDIEQIDQQRRTKGDVLQGDSRRYRYDAMARLTDEITEGQRLTYAYDPVGNRLRKMRDDTTTEYRYGTGNRLIERSDSELLIDDRGNLLAERESRAGKKTSKHYLYNRRNRPALLVENGQPRVSYGYTVNGLRDRKTLFDAQGKASTTRYAYLSGGRLLTSITAKRQQHHIWLGPIPVAQVTIDTERSVTNLGYLQSDHLHTPRVATNTEKTIVWRWDGNAFGEGTPETDPDGDGNHVDISLRFSGQYYDEESGLHYNVFRYYDPATGRYTQSDPIGQAGGINTYAYADASPTHYVDPLGLFLFAFDGTGNDRDNLGGNNANALTNVAHLVDRYQEANGRENVLYLRGVGTADSMLDYVFGGGSGLGGRRRINEALDRVDQLLRNPSWDRVVDIIGFSRGAAAAREFSNMIFARVDADGWDDLVTVCNPLNVRFMGLFDTVASIGAPGNGTDIGYNLTIDNRVGSVAHAVALSEHRVLFPLSSVSPVAGASITSGRIVEQGFIGAHSNIGGGYADSDLSDITLQWMYQQAVGAGVLLAPLLDEHRVVTSPVIHDERRGDGAMGVLNPNNGDRAIYYPNDPFESTGRACERRIRESCVQWEAINPAERQRTAPQFQNVEDMINENYRDNVRGTVDMEQYREWLRLQGIQQ